MDVTIWMPSCPKFCCCTWKEWEHTRVSWTHYHSNFHQPLWHAHSTIQVFTQTLFAETHKTLFFASFISAILALPCCVSTPENTILWWPTKQYFHIENASSLAVSTASLCHNNAAACAHISMNQTPWHQWLPPVSFSIKIFSLPQPESYFHKTEKLEVWQNDDIKE